MYTVGFGAGLHNTQIQPELVLGFKKKIKTQIYPICFLGRVSTGRAYFAIPTAYFLS